MFPQQQNAHNHLENISSWILTPVKQTNTSTLSTSQSIYSSL